jgi:HTH-type transcriptional regulator, sugar sensing transcriptional regulator
MRLVDELSALGLGGKKSSVYLALLQLGTATVMDLSKAAGMKRPTVYDVLAELIAMNLVTQSFKGKRRMFAAEPPANLNLIPQRQEGIIQSILPDLKALYDQGPRKPRIRYYEGVEGVKLVSEELLTARNREYFYFGSIKEIVELTGKEYQRDFVRRRIEKKIWSNAIRVREKELPDGFLSSGPQNFRRLRFFPKPIAEDVVSLYVFDNNIVITSAIKENYGMIIESRELAVLMKTLWQYLWAISEEP